VSAETIAAARRGDWAIYLTTSKAVPHAWFPVLASCRVLCLAGGGGQQGPILAAAGAVVTVLDFSPAQLAQDRMVAARDGLTLATVEGDMADLAEFGEGAFDLIVHPVANTYVPAIRPVWAAAYRVLRPGGVFIAGFINPANFIFADDALAVQYALPFADLTSRTAEDVQQMVQEGDTFQWSHTLTGQIGGQIDAGFVIAGFFEDAYADHKLTPYMPTHMVTRAVQPLGR
jgi:SAM-dependent methyltransferase